MVQRVADALLEQPADLADDRRVAEIAADDVAAQRQRQARLLLPPHAQIDDQVQPLVLKRELAFVDDQPGVEFAGRDRGDDLVERHDFVREIVAEQQLQGRETPSSSCRARRSSCDVKFVDRHRLAEPRPSGRSVAHAAAAGQQRVLVEQVGVGVDADGGHFQFAAQCPAIERLDVLQFVLELEIARVESCRGPGRRT